MVLYLNYHSDPPNITITPTGGLTVGQRYAISYPPGAFIKNTGAGSSYVGTGYTFTAKVYGYQLWGVGNGYVGTLGQNQGPTGNYSSPVQVPGNNWEYIYDTCARNDHAVAAKSDGTLWSWGYNATGGLGHNNTTQYSSPTQIPGTTWRAGAFNEHNTMATKSDGTLWMMGRGIAGVLGFNVPGGDNAHRSSPVQVPGTTWSNDRDKNAMIGSSAAAIKTDGTLWTWGDSNDGVLGHNDTGRWPGRANSRSSPVQVGTDTTWRKVDAGYYAF